MLRLVILLAALAAVSCQTLTVGEVTVLNPNFRAVDHHHAAGHVMCSAGCRETDHMFQVEMKICPRDEDCSGAKYDTERMQKYVIRRGQRFTGVYEGWGCVLADDASCPDSYTYFAFMAYGVESRNGTKYWITHTYEKLHMLLMQM
jgi:hypothetical protein